MFNNIKYIYSSAININADILGIKRQMESISGVNRLLVELSKGSTCANKDIMFTFLTRQGSQNLLKVCRCGYRVTLAKMYRNVHSLDYIFLWILRDR